MPTYPPVQPRPADPAGAATVVVSRRRISRVLWIAVAAVPILGLGQRWLSSSGLVTHPAVASYLQLFNLDGELTLPAWFESSMMLFAALLMALNGAAARRHDPRNAVPWFVLAGIFVFLSADESMQIHERLSIVVNSFGTFTGVLAYSWVVAMTPIAIGIGLVFLPFLLRLPSPVGRRLLVAGIVFVLGAIGCELIGGWLMSRGETGWPYALEVAAEETLEMAGLVLAIGAVLDYLRIVAPKYRANFTP